MSKRELHRFHVQAPLRSQRRRGRKLVIRLVRDTKTSTVEENRQLGVGSGEDSRLPTSSGLVPGQKRNRRALQWWLLWLSVASIPVVAVISGVLWLTQLPPPIDCQRISSISPDGDRLYCAQRAASSGKLEQLVAATKLVQQWTPAHPLYSEAQRLLKEWSESILSLAQQKINQGDLSGAVTIASKIPVSSPIYSEAQAEIATWKQEWRTGEKIISQFKDALKVQKWQQASQLIAELSKSNREYWRMSRVDEMLEQLSVEKETWQQLEEARDLAKSNTQEQLEKAIALAGQISANSYVKAQARLEESRWSQQLLEIAATRFKDSDFAGVVSVAKAVPVHTSQYPEAQDWIRLGGASEIAEKNNILALVDALTAVRHIAPKSPVHSLAKTQAALWQSQLQDHAQLQLALVAASVEQRTGLTYAIDQATRVAPESPQRLRAQRLIASWRKEIQQIDDRNLLANAQQLAFQGTMEPLKAAVEIASKIKLGQPLRIDAQTEIAKWNKQIQRLEDQPILDLAEALAQRRDLIAAISTAGQIRPDRPLYSDAQKAIANWVAQVQIAQDRPILDAASALAVQGRFDAAIATAAQIPPQRALYEQAQAAIAAWTSQRDAISRQTLSAPLDLD